MKKFTVFSCLLLISLLITFSNTLNANEEKSTSSASTNKITVVERDQQNNKGKISSVDGTTSASQLRAKKSHSVSSTNETILSVSLGVLCIGIIVFLLKILGKNN
jgi:hypothetical protein